MLRIFKTGRNEEQHIAQLQGTAVMKLHLADNR